jgi:cytochrome c
MRAFLFTLSLATMVISLLMVSFRLEAAAVIDKEYHEKASRLLQRHRCITCHQMKVNVVGPAYSMVAEKYFEEYMKEEEKLFKRLKSKIRKGGSGTWGQAYMTPHPHLSDKDLDVLLHFIMNQKFDKRGEIYEKHKEEAPKPRRLKGSDL